MDEAGLPEEGRESLKVLHYLLEGHMSMKAPVGFVSISNHILDAAKSNRCAVLLRPEPDAKELKTIAGGLLFKKGADGVLITREVDFGGQVFAADPFANLLCKCYSGLIHGGVNAQDLETFFGLRDFIYFVKALKCSSSAPTTTKMCISLQSFVHAVERNFNGLASQALNEIIVFFLKQFSSLPETELQINTARVVRGRMDVIAEAIKSNKASVELESRARFKLIIDCSEDDSIMRLLRLTGLLDGSKKSLFKLSHMSEDFALEKLRLISGVKFAAAQGNVAVLSQTEPVNESFFDLLNGNMRRSTLRDGEVALYANIAVGGVSRRSLVRPGFECIMHIRESQLQEMPAPFLNRFEKYRLDVSDVMIAGLAKLAGMAPVMKRARLQTEILLGPLIEEHGLFGMVNPRRTLDSVFVNMMPQWALLDANGVAPGFVVNPSDSFLVTIAKFILGVMELDVPVASLEATVEGASEKLSEDQRDLLERLSAVENSSFAEQLQSALQSLLSEPRTDLLSSLCQVILQMAITKQAVRSLLRLATPEAVYAKQHVLPREVLNDFLHLGHSSLKQMIERELVDLQNSPVKLIVSFTRTDAFNHCIPTLAPSQDMSRLSPETAEKIKGLVCERLNEVIIERLESLRSEAKLRNSITAWAQHTQRRVYVLLVDMNESKAVERCNYIRMCAEQHVHGVTNKMFLLVLHYHPSTSLKSDCYSALMLGGWTSIFLDGVGQMGPELGVNQWMKMACQPASADGEEVVEKLAGFLEEVLPRILGHLACQKIYHPRQLTLMPATTDDLFSLQLAALETCSKRRIGDETIGEILCKKFAREWRQRALPRVAQLASQGLLEGTTQLSMGTSIQSTFAKTFEAYVMLSFVEMNRAQNLDVLDQVACRKGVEDLFGCVLKGIPLVPFEEMLLQHEHVQHRRQMSPGVGITGRFPFFAMVSFCIDECLEQVERNVASEGVGKLNVKRLQQIKENIFPCAMTMVEELTKVEDTERQTTGSSNRSKPFLQAIQFVLEASDETRAHLFKLYMCQFVEHRTGCSSNKVITEWLEREVGKISSDFNILAIHCVERYRQLDFMRLVSWSSAIEHQLPSICENILNGLDVDGWQQNSFVNTLFDRLLILVEANLVESLDESSEWNRMLCSLLAQIRTGLIEPHVLQREDTKSRLRIFVLFQVLASLSTAIGQQAVIGKWYDIEQRSVKAPNQADASLQEILALAGHANGMTELILRGFLSPSMRNVLPTHFHPDVCCLLDLINSGAFTGEDHRVAVSLLQSACSGTDSTKCTMEGLSVEALSIVNSKLACLHLTEFSPDGVRTRVPHFIPRWLCATTAMDEERSQPSSQSRFYPQFFSFYQHSYEGSLASVAFEMLMDALLRQACSLSSSDLLLLLVQDIEAEVEFNSGNPMTDQTASLAGTAAAAMIADIRVICFVSRVAQELAEHSNAAALSGAEGELGAAILEEIMQLPDLLFKEFFCALIVHHSGEGSLASLLRQGGQLHEFSFCQQLQQGLPSHREGHEAALRTAERNLAEAQRDEERKAMEFRLCPHCGAQFAVDLVNCGTFYCGRDAHGVHGAPAIGGRAVNQVYGCNRQFTLDSARPYRINEDTLAPLRGEVERRTVEYRDFESAQSHLKAVYDFELPTLLVFAQQQQVRFSPVPATAIMDEKILSSVQGQHLQILLDGSNFMPELSALSDLVELYVWLHDTFRYLITREEALSTTMGNIMKKETLLKRFGRVHTMHLLSLWGRISTWTDTMLKDSRSKFFWNCQEIVFEFASMEEAPLISLLSDGSGPEDGNDFLFLVINSIMNKYNRFVERFSELRGFGQSPDLRAGTPGIIHPKTIVPGSAGSIAVNLLPLLSKFDVDAICNASWNRSAKTLSTERLECMLASACFRKELPRVIGSPLDCLREQFIFRDDNHECDEAACYSRLVFAMPSGLYFAREQDYKLAKRGELTLKRFGLTTRDERISGPLKVNFHGLDSHQKVSSMLTGLCNLFDLLSSDDKTEFLGMRETVESIYRQKTLEELMASLGFPELSPSQWRLVGSLQPDEVAELVHYLIHQLAVEGYLYAKYDLCVTDPIQEESRSVIQQNISSLCSKQGPEQTLKEVSSFVEDILSHYKRAICQEALRGATLLQTFLVDINALDSTDSVLSCLPKTLTVRNFVSLQQSLRQVRLSLLWKSFQYDKQGGAFPFSQGREDQYRAAQEKGWLWEGEASVAQGTAFERERSFEGGNQGLWFASARSEEKKGCSSEEKAGDPEVLAEAPAGDKLLDETVSASKPELMEWQESSYRSLAVQSSEADPVNPEALMDIQQKSATLIQNWWRAHLKKRKRYHDDSELEQEMVFEDEDKYSEAGSRTWSQGPSNDGDERMTEISMGKTDEESDDPQQTQDLDKGATDTNDAIEMSAWLDQLGLSRAGREALAKNGVCTMEDIQMVVESDDLLALLPKLDQHKLKASFPKRRWKVSNLGLPVIRC